MSPRLVLGVLMLASWAMAGTPPGGFTDSVIVSGISSPTAFAFAPDGRILVCEQGGKVRVVKNGVLLSTPFVSLTVDSSGERGLLGIAFDPAFTTNAYVYVYYTATTPVLHNRVSRLVANGDTAVANSETVLLDLNPLSSATNHNGGAIHFGVDGKLYIGVGENANSANAQNLGNLLGKLLRMNPDGSVPADNPFANTAIGQNRLIWAYGLRNPFTFDVQPATGTIYINDVGQNTWEEIDLGRAGANYGWPASEGPTSNPAYDAPLFVYGHAAPQPYGCAITGGSFYNPATVTFPASYVGRYFFADTCSGWIYVFDPQARTAAPFLTGASSPVDLHVAGDGSLYYVQRGNGELHRVIYTLATTTVSRFVPLNPCRLLDTRSAPEGALAAGASRTVSVVDGGCGAPLSATAYSLNVTAVPRGALGFLSVWPTGSPRPNASTLNSPNGKVVANAAIVTAGAGAAVELYASEATDIVLDINGYFERADAGPQTLAYYPVTPCRVIDTRQNSPLAAGQDRSIPIAGTCGVPANAQAFALNATVVPRGALRYLTLFPSGLARPFVSTLNSFDGTVVANAALVPSGENGAISAYATDAADLVLDINGYFALAAAGGLGYYPVTPCRVADTRNTQPLDAGVARTLTVTGSSCGIPANAQAFNLNATVVPTAALGYLTLWPAGSAQPFVSTLNSPLGLTLANMAVIPAGSQGAVAAYATDRTQLVLDINGYFAP